MVSLVLLLSRMLKFKALVMQWKSDPRVLISMMQPCYDSRQYNVTQEWFIYGYGYSFNWKVPLQCNSLLVVVSTQSWSLTIKNNSSHLKYLKLHQFIFFQIFSFCVQVTSSSLGDTFSLICFKISFDILMYSLLYIQLIFFTFESSQALFYWSYTFHTLVRELVLVWYDYLEKLPISTSFHKPTSIPWLLRSDW